LELSSAAPLRVALVGAGRVGTSVCELLRARGHAIVGVASRTTSSATTAAERLGSEVFDLDAGMPAVDLVLVGTSDDAIEPTAIRLAPFVDDRVVVCHFAGVYGVEPLSAVVTSGAGACALHPVQSCPDVDTAVRRLPGSAWGITTSEGLGRWAASFVAEEMAGVPVPVAEEDRAIWHAAAVMTANGVSALLATGEALLAALGIDSPETVLGPLAAGTVANAREGGGGADTLTGPVARGDIAAIETHLATLEARAPELAHSYALIARLILNAAVDAGRVDASARAEIDAVLGAR
jgi:predicted short-subunit dehydrogenase-like oxidoreductase (DUF2520 family)